jgi:hypothetical protein
MDMQLPHPHHRSIPLATVSVTLMATMLVSDVCAQSHDSGPEWFEHSRHNAWLLPYDTTLISRRALAELSYESHDSDENFWKVENSLRGGYAIGENLAFGFQLMLPVKWNDTSSSSESGLGDLELRSGFIGRISPDLRWGTGLNVEFDTATNSLLGGNALVFRPTLAFRWDANHRLNLGVNVEYNFTPKDEQDDDVSALELKFPLAFKLNDRWSAASTYKPKWDYLRQSERHRFELGVTRVWGSENQIAFSFNLEVPLSSESFDYKLISGLAWHF